MSPASSVNSQRADDAAANDIVASPSRSGAIASRAGLRSSVKGQMILNEEEYVAALSYLIRRDYFPDNEAVAVAYTQDGEEVNDGYLPAKVVQHLGLAAAEALTIGTFQANFTSDDNASFQDILESEKRKRKSAYSWAYEAESKDGSRAKARNALFYAPPAIQPSSSRADRLLTSAGDRACSSKQIDHRRTRISADNGEGAAGGSQAGSMTPRSSRIDAAIDGEGSVSELSGADEGEHDGQQYGFVRPIASPRFQDLDRKQQAQMMTWGKIASTPRAVDQGEDGIYDGRFRIPATPKRDVLARSLAGKRSGSRASSSSNRNKAHGSHTATPMTPGRRTPADLTPAARTLLERTRRRKE